MQRNIKKSINRCPDQIELTMCNYRGTPSSNYYFLSFSRDKIVILQCKKYKKINKSVTRPNRLSNTIVIHNDFTHMLQQLNHDLFKYIV